MSIPSSPASEFVTGELRDAKTDFAGAAASVRRPCSAVILFFVFIGWLIAVLVSALLLVAFGTSQARRAAANIGGDTLKTIVVGLLMLILPWIVIGLLFVTVVGIPLAIGLAVLWGFTAFLGYLVVGLWLGQLHPDAQPHRGPPLRRRLPGCARPHAHQLIPFVGPHRVAGSALAP